MTSRNQVAKSVSEQKAQSSVTALVPYNPRFKFGWAYVADCAEQALMIRLQSLSRQFDATMKEVRQANKALASMGIGGPQR